MMELLLFSGTKVNAEVERNEEALNLQMISGYGVRSFFPPSTTFLPLSFPAGVMNLSLLSYVYDSRTSFLFYFKS